jgi:hypothetical protein
LDAFIEGLDLVPAILLVVVEFDVLEVLDSRLGRQSIVGAASIYPFCHNVLLAARNEEPGAMMTTTICHGEPRLAALLGILPGVATAVRRGLGYLVGAPLQVGRRVREECTTVDRIENPVLQGQGDAEVLP